MTASESIVQLAVAPFNGVALQKEFVPSPNVTVPVGFMPVTEALSVNGWFSTKVLMQVVETAVDVVAR